MSDKPRLIEPGTEVVLAYVIVPRDKWEDCKFPSGCYAKAYEVGQIETLIDQSQAKGWGAMIAVAICRLAVFLCPDQAEAMKLFPPALPGELPPNLKG